MPVRLPARRPRALPAGRRLRPVRAHGLPRLPFRAPPVVAAVAVRRGRARVIPAIPAGSWAAAGNRFFKRTIVPPIPISRYTGRASGVPLTGGQAQGALSGSGALTLSVGPQGLGTIWYPAQVTVSTSIGPLDTSTALVYYGIGGVPTTLVGSVFTGNGTVALALPPMQPGEFIIVTWTGGTAAAIAALNIVGTMDALITGS